MLVKFIDLDKQREQISHSLIDRICNVVRSNQFILGPEVDELESRLASYLNVKNVVTCGNGTDALRISLLALGIGQGDAVFCPSFTFAATAESICLVGATPVFVDTQEDHTMSVDDLRLAYDHTVTATKLTPRAVMPVDLFGMPADYTEIKSFCIEHDLRLVVDAAQSIGGEYNGQKCGTIGELNATSFYPSKPLSCYGDGGAIMTNDDYLASLAKSIRFHGKGDSQYDNQRIGMTSRLDTIQAAILLEKLTIFPLERERRNEIQNAYLQCLPSPVRYAHHANNKHSGLALFTVSSPRRDELRKWLSDRNIPTMVYYKKPLHLQPAYHMHPISPSMLPNTQSAADSVISLPFHPYLSRAAVEYICDSIAAFYRAYPPEM